MADKVVKAKVDFQAKTVTFGEGLGPDPKALPVIAGDTVAWELQNVPGGSKARVKFESPSDPNARLLENGHMIEGAGGVVRGGAVRADAPNGRYSYRVELVDGTQTHELQCVWSASGPILMAGIDKGAAP